jgi:peptidoglycan/xylan/chitin deacetylase (PgdA/CDA1 family)
MTAQAGNSEPAPRRRAADHDASAPDAAGLLDRWLPTPLLRVSALLHVAALASLVVAPRRWRWAVAAAAADHAVLLAASLSPRSTLLGPNLNRLPASDGTVGDGAVVLSFDDGPDPEATPRVLDLLASAGARASFFVIGRRAAAHPELVRRIAAEGHCVENHTWSHPPGFAFGGPGAMGREIDRAQRILGDLAGRPPVWFRAPAGMRNPLLAGVLARRGLSLASWTRRGFDTVDPRPRRVARRLTRDLAAGDVLLLHDGAAGAPGARRAGSGHVAVEALPAVLATLRRRGLATVPLPDPPPSGSST